MVNFQQIQNKFVSHSQHILNKMRGGWGWGWGVYIPVTIYLHLNSSVSCAEINLQNK